MKARPLPASVRRQIRDRSGGLCELQCGRTATEVHHRKLRSQGGRHELSNLLHLCSKDHREAHDNPELAYALGWLVHSWERPEDVPVLTDSAA